MEETKKEEKQNEEFKKVEKKAKLSPTATVLITIAATLGTVVVARVIYFIITGA